MERQATQPAAVPNGRKRRRASSKKNEEQKAKDLDIKTTQPPTNELVIALNALPRAEEPPPPQTVNELMDCALKDYQEECVEEETFPSDPATEVGEWEEHDLDQMEANLNDLLYQACPFHPHQFIHCVNPQTDFGSLRYKCPQEGCPVYLFKDTRDIMLEKLKVDTHPQVRAQLQRGLLKCKCRFTPKMKLSRTTKNYNKVFLSCGSFLPGPEPCGFFQWLHGQQWRPREHAQPSLRRWVKETPHGNVPVPLLKKHCLDTGREQIVGPTRRLMLYGTSGTTGWTSICKPPIMPDQEWLNQFAEVTEAQERERERRRHLHKNIGSMTLF